MIVVTDCQCIILGFISWTDILIVTKTLCWHTKEEEKILSPSFHNADNAQRNDAIMGIQLRCCQVLKVVIQNILAMK